MLSDPEKALPMVERLLSGASSAKAKNQALFILSQSGLPRSRELIANIAKGGANPDLQIAAIRYLRLMGGAEARDLLFEVYRSSSDRSVRRAILRSYMTSGDRDRLLALAKSESSPDLRAEAVQQLGVIGAAASLSELYQTEASPEVKRRILRAMAFSGNADRVVQIAKTEKDPALRKTAIQSLGLLRRQETTEALTSIYGSDSSADIRMAVIHALFLQGQAKVLVDLARAERSPELRKAIIERISMMRTKESTDYLLERLK
jgi:HEAT repeat protein